MIYAGIDVNIITHEKALAAGIEAFGLWSWGMCYAQLHVTDGRLPRVAVLSALAGRRNIIHAKRLVEAGLWVDNDDGSWSIWNYGKKNQTAEEIQRKKDAAAERARRWRDRHVTRDVTRDERVSTPPSPSLQTSPAPEPPPAPSPENKTNESESARVGLGRKELPRDEPLTDSRIARVEALTMPKGLRIDADSEWRKFVATTRANGKLVASVDDAWEKWLIDAMGYLERDRRLESDRREAAQRRRDGPPPPPKPTREQSKKFAEELAARMAADLAKKGAA